MSESDEAANDAVAAAAAALDAAAAEASGHYELEAAIRASIRAARSSPELPWLQGALQAVTYRLRVGHRTTDYEPFLILVDGTTDPPRIDAQPDKQIQRWVRLHAAATHPVLRSRLAHLVVHSARAVTGKARVDLADAAAGDSLATPRGWGAGLDRADALPAAAGLAKRFGDKTRRIEALAAITEAARAELAHHAAHKHPKVKAWLLGRAEWRRSGVAPWTRVEPGSSLRGIVTCTTSTGATESRPGWTWSRPAISVPRPGK